MTDSNSQARPPYTIVIIGLILYSLAALVGLVALAWAGRDSPGELVSTLGMAIGGLVGVLSGRSMAGGDA